MGGLKMTNLNILETFRTKEELLNYFDEIGQNITEEEIEQLKQSYTKAEENGSALRLQQLDQIAGGGFKICIYLRAARFYIENYDLFLTRKTPLTSFRSYDAHDPDKEVSIGVSTNEETPANQGELILNFYSGAELHVNPNEAREYFANLQNRALQEEQ